MVPAAVLESSLSRSRLSRSPVKGPSGSRDSEGFRKTFLEFFPRLRSFFHSRGFSRSDAEDLSQNTLWNVYRSGEQFRGEGSLESWIYAAARNAARDEWRRQKRTGMEGAMAEDPPSDEPAPDVAVSGREELARAFSVLSTMPARMRACLLLRVQESLSYRQIACRLSLSVHTVRVQIWNARRRLRLRGIAQ
jgi:RNA polymerase sigma-70 factor (ECF subfamily)